MFTKEWLPAWHTIEDVNKTFCRHEVVCGKEQNAKKESKSEGITLMGHSSILICLGFFPDVRLIILQVWISVLLNLAKKMKFASTTEEALSVCRSQQKTQTNVLTRPVQNRPRVSTLPEVTSVSDQVRHCTRIGIKHAEFVWIKHFRSILDVSERYTKHYAIETYMWLSSSCPCSV